jgi:hypothetical protein
MEISDLTQVEEMQRPNCKRTFGVARDADDSSPWLMECRCGLYREVPIGAVIFGIGGPKGVLTVFRPRLAG